LPIRCAKHPGAAMAKMWRWAAGLQAAVKLLHRRSALAWHAPTAGMVWALEAVALASGRHAPGRVGVGGRRLGLSGMTIDGMGGNGVGDSLALVTCSTICLTLVAANSCNALKSPASCSVL
jgi:hypothetical protein